MSDPYIQFQVTFWAHHKTERFCRMLNVDAIRAAGMLAKLWTFTFQNAWRDGNLELWGAERIARELLWTGDPDALIEALRECGGYRDGEKQSGFLDDWTVHNWLKVAGKLVKDRLGKEAKRRGAHPEVEPDLPAEDSTDYEAIRAAWNAGAERLGLSHVREMTRDRKRKVRARGLTVERLEAVLRAAAEQPFLMGQGDGGWEMNFDWLIKNDDNAAKVIERRYASKRPGKAGAAEPEAYTEALDRRRASSGVVEEPFG